MKLGTGNIQLMLESKTSIHSKLLTVKQRAQRSNGGPVSFHSILMSSLIYTTTPRKNMSFLQWCQEVVSVCHCQVRLNNGCSMYYSLSQVRKEGRKTVPNLEYIHKVYILHLQTIEISF